MAMTQTELLHALEPVVEVELNRHEKVAKEWFPHEYIPWSEGRNFDGIYGGEAWEEGHSKIPEAARVSLIVNLLTEDNLPSYHHEIATTFGRDGAWGTWVHRWTAEEDRHGTALRDYLTVTRAVDPVALERARMAHMESGFMTEYNTMLQQLAYVSFQELATRIAHRNTGRASGEEGCERLLARIAADENLHMLFYRNLLKAAFELDPNQTMRAVTDVVTTFQMPGQGMDGFARKAMIIANEGIYDLRLHLDDVLMPVLRQWSVFDKTGLDAEGEKAREELSAFLAKADATAARFVERREERRARAAARQ
ncbi:Probable acyl-ACP desaturase, Stearoyl-ACP desaturase [[Actinomadura] parvosata subsp. kistnae]|uniref:Acyl-ACP desaturase n=1 Tax=[Actinomadura] parvosata subsp. kistnae TaxID=1909395 RepID=A0A1V0A2X7_9ACTN|nr:acyl-ACP desaturase [Nonomuraea sp. ATCC 55076]AQZ64566.1 acyl-ACP desaturase [Nonomuraea sp. ATCC 55076]SPL99615.1 Probable acyl-ACP desaturase, Stearoyl-ACP desaturase [Actinomadura parvosata subsp. kistnae]